jgi:hypothetical protein
MNVLLFLGKDLLKLKVFLVYEDELVFLLLDAKLELLDGFFLMGL